MQAPSSAERYHALDALRGFVMLALCSQGFGLGHLDPKLYPAALWFEHLPWDGLIPWELIMPSFVFMIGTALPFALARRRAQGANPRQLLRHALVRTFRLILLGQILTCLYEGRYAYEPYETLTQLALSYLCCFLILQMAFRRQALAAVLLMLVNWGVYVLFPGSAGPFSPNDNIGVIIDRAVFGLNHASSWATINFLGSSVTMLFGAWTGALIMSARPPGSKMRILALGAAASLVLGAALTPVIPIIHKAWTASFTFWHTGILLLASLAFFWLFDVRQYRRLCFPLVVVGMNSIFIYLVNQSLRGGIDKSLGIFTGRFQFLGTISPAVQACAVTLVLWYLCYWLYGRKIFFKV